ncbi:MAG: DUF6103 family protein [Acutalibacteraceae bacterium]
MEQNVNGVFACAFDAEKVKAMRTYAEQKGIDLDAEITKVLERKYIQIVPKPVREYIDFSNAAQPPKQKKKPKSAAKDSEIDAETAPVFASDFEENSENPIAEDAESAANSSFDSHSTASEYTRAPPLRSRPRGVFGDMQRSARITASSL